MAFDAKKKKISIIVISAILLMIIIGVVAYSVIHEKEKSVIEKNPESSLSVDALKAICERANYKETCEQSLKLANTSDPNGLIKVTLQQAMANISESIKASSLLKESSTDPMTSQALDICKEVLDTSIEDIQSSIDKVGSLELSENGAAIGDLKTWIGGAITFHETCLDAFENTTGDTGDKMKNILKTAGELTSNGLAMVSSYAQVLQQLHIPSTTRRLLQYGSDEIFSFSGFPTFVDGMSRRLLINSGVFPKPNAIVAHDGTGQFKTINAALKIVPKKNTEPFIIFVKAGVYKEHVHILKNMTRVVLVGEGPTKTKITGSKNFADGTKTFHTATVAVDGTNFIARDIGFENSAGPLKHQAVAVRVTGDFAVFFNCQIDGYQDTLYAHNKRQFYRDCTISGTIDFVFGDAQAIFQNCKFIVRKPLPNQACMVTAQGRKDINGPGALVFQNCKILAAPEFNDDKSTNVIKAYLGRPWKEYSRTIIINSFIDGFIAPEGWSPWVGDFALDTCYYAEYQNKGPGAENGSRVTWKGIRKISPQIADSFTPAKYYQGDDAWIKGAFIPYDSE